MICDLFLECSVARKIFSIKPIIFKVQNVADNYEKIKIEEFDLRPPWGFFSTEFKNISREETYSLVAEYTREQDRFNLDVFLFLHSSRFKFPNNFVGVLKEVKISFDGRKVIDEGLFFFSKEWEGVLDEDGAAQLINFMFFIFKTSVTFSHLKNVVKHETSVNSRLTIKRKAEGLFPVEKYYTLKIDKFKTNKAGLKKTKGDPWKMPLTVVRGHSKDFSVGRGLFGKIKKSDIWFDPFVRGSSSNGMIHKEYEAAV